MTRRQPLQIRSGETLALDIPAAAYRKLRVGLFDSGRREVLSFLLSTPQLAAIATETEVELRAGSARVHLGRKGMGTLREVVRRLEVGAFRPAPNPAP